MSFYRDVSKREIDFVIDDRIGIEVKSSELVDDRDMRVLDTVGRELAFQRSIVVSREPHPRRVGRIEVLPVLEFCKALWSGELTSKK